MTVRCSDDVLLTSALGAAREFFEPAKPVQVVKQGQGSAGTQPMRRYRIAVIPGDGVGKELIPAGLEVLKAVADAEFGERVASEVIPSAV
jgi:hypothetical protein